MSLTLHESVSTKNVWGARLAVPHANTHKTIVLAAIQTQLKSIYMQISASRLALTRMVISMWETQRIIQEFVSFPGFNVHLGTN